MATRIPITFLVEPRLVTLEAAQHALGFKSRTTLWKERALGRIKTVSYNRVAVAELDRYAAMVISESPTP